MKNRKGEEWGEKTKKLKKNTRARSKKIKKKRMLIGLKLRRNKQFD